MAKLTGTDASVAARRGASGWMHWAHSARDGLAHAFPVEDSQREGWLQAVCTHIAPPAALGTATVLDPRCARCVLVVAATGAIPRHSSTNRPGAYVRLLAWLRRHRHDQQAPPLARALDITLPLTTVEPADHDVRAPDMVGPGRTTRCDCACTRRRDAAR